jgi:hypothetical protein
MGQIEHAYLWCPSHLVWNTGCAKDNLTPFDGSITKENFIKAVYDTVKGGGLQSEEEASLMAVAVTDPTVAPPPPPLQVLIQSFEEVVSSTLIFPGSMSEYYTKQQGKWLGPAMMRTGCGDPADHTEVAPGLVRSHCHSVPPLIHFMPEYSLTYSVPLFLNRQCDRTLGDAERPRRV